MWEKHVKQYFKVLWNMSGTNPNYFLDLLSNFCFVSIQIICKYNVTLPTQYAGQGACLRFRTTWPFVFMSMCPLFSCCLFFILSSPFRKDASPLANLPGVTLRSIMVSAHSFVSRCQNSWLPGKDTTAQGCFLFVVGHRWTDEQLRGGEEWVEEGSGQRMRNDRWTNGVVSSRTKWQLE